MAIIDPDGLFEGERLRQCTDMARLHWPYLFLASNGYGRIELDYGRICRRAFLDFRAPLTEEQFWGFIQEYRDAHLLFLYEFRGKVWGQWDSKRGSLPRWHTKRDEESPAPPKEEWERWISSYRAESKPLPKISRNLQNIPKTSAGVGVGLGVGAGVGCGVGEVEAWIPLPTQPAKPQSNASERFEEFWERYPNKVGKDATCQAWVSIVTVEIEDDVFAGLGRWEASHQWQVKHYYQKPENWITKRLWKDEPPTPEMMREKTKLEQLMDAV